jgi:hypothetical protein
MQLAAMLYEAVTVVEDGFGAADAWADAYKGTSKNCHVLGSGV